MGGQGFHTYAALGIFVVSFACFLAFEKHRHAIAFAAALLVVGLGLFGPSQAIASVNWNIVVIFLTTLAAAEVFMLSGAAAFAAETILSKFNSPCAAILILCSLTGFLSMFVENVACVLIAAPVALSLAERLKMPPQQILVACALASNLQGCALLIGDPPSMLLAAEGGYSFFEFIWHAGRPSLFFAVQVGGIAGLVFLWFVFRKHTGRVHIKRTAKLLGIVPTLNLVGLVMSLAVATQVQHGVGWGAAAGCAFFCILSLVWLVLKTRGATAPQDRMRRLAVWMMLKGPDVAVPDEALEDAVLAHHLPSLKSYFANLDWKTTVFIMSVFVPVGALAHYGWVDRLARLILDLSGGNAVATFAFLVVTAMIISGFVDNIPFLLVMLPAVTRLAGGLGIEGQPTFLYFGLLLGTSVGGNITPIGAQANVAAVGLLRKHGHPMALWDYVKLSLPYTLLAVAASCAFTYLIYAP